MRYFKPLALFALMLLLCVLPKLTADEKLDLPGPKPSSALTTAEKFEPVDVRIVAEYPWESGNEAAIRQRLARRTGEIHFDGISFDQLLEHLRDLAGLNIVVNWSALETAAIDKDKEVSLKLMADTVTYETVLRLILEKVGGGEVELDYSIRGSVISISTKEDLSRTTQVVFYNVADILRAAEARRYGDSMPRLVHMLQTSVDPESWREAGGNVGSIIDFTDILVITQTSEAHRVIWDMLQALRWQLGLPVLGLIAPAVVD